MDTQKLYLELKDKLDSKISFLNDKPEETIESTIKACWFTAFGEPKSANEALKNPLPELNKEQIQKLEQLLELRSKNIPLAHITRRQNFMGIELLSDSRALIPRKETEILGEKALSISKVLTKGGKKLQIMDICCGAGNLGLAIAYYNPNVRVFSSDISDEAIELAKDNISFLNLSDRVEAKQGDLFSSFDLPEYYENIDQIICNPPYISSAKVPKMNTEISEHEPTLAFDGGMFGTKILQNLIVGAPKFLKEKGWLLFEVGLGQGEFVIRLIEESKHYMNVEPIADDDGNWRVIIAQKNLS